MSAVIGLDLGTSNITMDVTWPDRCYTNRCISIKTPSVITYHSDKPHLIGVPAKQYAFWNWENTIFGVKNILGRKYDDPVIQNIKKTSPYVIDRKGDDPVIKVACTENKAPLQPQDILTSLISHAKELAECHLKQKIKGAVVAVPVHFDEHQRQAIIDACNNAGVNVFQLINEPIAATFTCRRNLFCNVKNRSNILVFDMGSSLKMTIIKLARPFKYRIVKAANYELSGDEFDEKILDYMIDDMRATDVQFTPNKDFRRYMKIMAENAKIILSNKDKVTLEDDGDGKKYTRVLTRNHFELLCDELLARARGYLDKFFKQANMHPREICELVVAGGAGKMPMIKKMLSDYFMRDVKVDAMCDSLVAIGAASQAKYLTRQIGISRKDFLPQKLLSHSLGINSHSIMIFFAKKGTRLPCIRQMSIKTMSKRIDILEGERRFAIENRILGSLDLTGMMSNHEEPLEIDLLFEINVHGILKVIVQDAERTESPRKPPRQYMVYFPKNPYPMTGFSKPWTCPMKSKKVRLQKSGPLKDELKKSQLWIRSVGIERAHVSYENLMELRETLPRIMDGLNKNPVGLRRSRSSLNFSCVSKEIDTRKEEKIDKLDWSV